MEIIKGKYGSVSFDDGKLKVIGEFAVALLAKPLIEGAFEAATAWAKRTSFTKLDDNFVAEAKKHVYKELFGEEAGA